MPQSTLNIESKFNNAETTIFTKMSALAKQENAINLAQGFPDFDTDEKLIQLLKHYHKNGYMQYAPMQGVLELRKAIAHKTEKLYGEKYCPNDEITITAGATQAIYTAISAIVNEGDEVIVFTPAYDCYAPAIEINGGKTVYLKLNDKDFSVPWENLKNAISFKTKMIIINSPHNPTGAVLSELDMKKLSKLVEQTEIIILSDEVYEHIVFDNNFHQSVCKFPELSKRSFAVFSFGKTFHATGLKMGYCLAPAQLMEEFRKVHQYLIFCCPNAVQYALADYLSDENNYMHLGSFYQQKRDFFVDSIKNSRFNIIPSKGTYFQLLDYSKVSDLDDVIYAEQLTKINKLAAIPTSVFYEQANNELRNLRFCFAKNEETLMKAAKILCAL